MLTPEHIIWAYRILLDREPENEAAIRDRLDIWHTTRDLRMELMASPEFHIAHPDPAYTLKSSVVIKELGENLRLFVDLADYAIGLSIIRDSYEVSEIRFVRQIVKPGQTVLDIGANIGFYAITMGALVGESGKVYAFEPWARNADLLARSITENGFEQRVILERALVGQAAGTGQLMFPDQTVHFGGAHLFEERMELLPGHSLNNIPMISLDSYAFPDKISFIKIDIEGAEPLAFRGAERLLHTDRPLILSEIHPQIIHKVSQCSPATFIAEMQARDYTCYLLENGTVAHQVTDIPLDQVWSVVFLPNDAPHAEILSQIISKQTRTLTEQTRTITEQAQVIAEQTQTMQALQDALQQRVVQVQDLEQRAEWLAEQARALRQTLNAVEQGRLLRLLRWLQRSP